MIIRILKQEHGTVLVEWDGEEGKKCRGIAPEEILSGSIIDDRFTSLIIPYGVDWEFIIGDSLPNVTPRTIADNLRKADIWTAEDLLKYPAKVQAAIMQAYGVDLSMLIRLTKNYLKEVRNGN